ncbi:MAG: hypothetical protein QMD66_02975 [Actinomycetota bacterium]|nr:hypothetical protein [Actinomycetota bacterium]MDI6821825.1 hypothetical protein [Actinomycetota bacterium]
MFWRRGKYLWLFSIISLIIFMCSLIGCEVKSVEKPKPEKEVVKKAVKPKPPKISPEGGLPPIEKGFKDCTFCHGSIDFGQVKEKIFDRKLLTFSHVPHINIGVKCSTCHKLPVHVKKGVNRPPMQICYGSECHSLTQAKAPGKCEACHPPDFDLKPKNHLVATFLLVPKPGVRADHAKMAKEEKKYCEMCHLDKFCTDCHGMEIPHPEKFVKKEHGPVGKAKPQSCMKCHPEPKFCDVCHHEGYKPEMGPWTKVHPAFVEKKTAEYCFKCHDSYSPFCAECHVRMFRR